MMLCHGDISIGELLTYEPWSVMISAAAVFLFLLSQIAV